ncbi:MAG TPA: GAF domain-containing protein [Candidatus Hydrogenedentes bacterium]|nr:GAF domain-containing protein [Candidatus Hydrogenedentota bacterium]
MRRKDESAAETSTYAEALRELTARHEQLVIELSLLKRLDALDPLRTDVQALCGEMARAIASVLRADNCSIMLLDAQGQYMQILGAASSFEEQSPENRFSARFSLGEGIAGHVAQTGAAVMADDVQDHPEFKPLPNSPTPIRSLLCFPLLAHGSTLGVVNVSAVTPGYFTDVTKQVMELSAERIARLLLMQHYHQRLSQSEQQFRQFVDNSPEPIARVDKEWRYVYGNRAFQAAVGIPEAEVRGASVERVKALIHPDDLTFFWECCETVMKTGSIRLCDVRYRNAEGAWRWISHLAYPWRLPDGTIGGIEAIGRDITEQKNAEAIIAEQRLKLEASARLTALGGLASGVAHEINNPLAIISLGAEQLDLLVQQTPLNINHIHSAAGKIRRNVSRIERIIRGLRTLSQDGSKEPFQCKKVVDVVQEVAELCQTRFQSHNIDMQIGEIPNSLEMECRPVLIAQVLMNLFINAFDAVENAPDRWIKVECREHKECVVIRVMDSGPGVPDELREHVFNPFFTSKEVGKGTGMGLSISKAIIENHHGELSLEAESPNTCFVMTLPKRQPRSGMHGDKYGK